MKTRKPWAWVYFILGLLYFFIPLGATFLFSLKAKKGELSFLAYQRVFADPQFWSSFLFSVEMALITVVIGLIIVIPAVLLAHGKFPKVKLWLEILSVLPFVVPPIVLVFGLIRCYSSDPFPLVSSPLLLAFAYVVISFPFLYRSLDAGLKALDFKTLVEACQSLGAGGLKTFFYVVMPNLRSALLSAVFLTFATVLGELTMAVMLGWPAFGPYMAQMGRDLAYEPAALSVISFVLIWACLALMNLSSRRK